jgi:pyruvate dehydrogenase E2 component (dihydrolipoyllysine-residue acetyltransferase)
MSAKGETTVQEPTRAEQAVARRMAEAKATIPHFTVAGEVDVERCGEVSSVLPVVVKACGLALREHPRLNGAYRDGRFELYGRVNVGIAVAADGAVVLPTVFDADRKPLEEIAREVRALGERVQDGSITPPELSGGTFTVIDLSACEITSVAAVIQPHQAALLALGGAAPRAVARDGQVVARRVMTVTLSCDHRILSPAGAAEFLTRLRALLERPDALAP